MKNKIMNNILNYVKDEFKDQVRLEVEKMTRDFLKLSDEEKEEVYDTDGTIGYVFGTPEYDYKFSFEFKDVMIEPDDEREVDLCELVIDYLHYHIDENSDTNTEMYHEDERFIIEYQLDGIYSVVDKVTKEEYVLDNLDSDMSMKTIVQYLYDRLEDEEDSN